MNRDTPITKPDQAAAAVRSVQSLGRWIRTFILARGLFLFLAILVGVIAISLGLDLWLRLDLGARVWLAHAMVFGLGYGLWRWVLAPQKGSWGTLDVAAATERVLGRPGWLTRPLATLGTDQLGFPDDGELQQLARDEAASQLADANLRSRLPWSRGLRFAAGAAVLLAIPVVAALARPADASLWFRRWFLGSDARWPQDTYLELVGVRRGMLLVPRGEPHELRVRVVEGTPPESVEATLRLDGAPRTNVALSRYAEDDFRMTLPPVQRSGEIRIRGGDDRRGPYTILPVDRPRIEEFVLTAELPGSAPEVVTFRSQDRDLAFKARSRMHLRVRTTQATSSVNILADTEQGIAIRTEDPQVFDLTWIHEGPKAFALELLSADTGLRSHAYGLTIAILEDRAPRVSVRTTGVRSQITPNALIPVRVLADDDFGLARIEVSAHARSPAGQSRAPRSTAHELLTSSPEQPLERQTELEHRLEVSELAAEPGESIEIGASGSDRCHLGPQTGTSRTRNFVVVRADLLLREILLRLQRVRAEFRQGVQDSRAQQDRLKEDLAAADYEPVLKAHRLLERTCWTTRRVLSESVEELVLNRLIEAQSVQLIENTVLEPLSALHDRTLTDLRSDLEARLSGAPEPDNGALRRRQEAVTQSMERILAAMQQWDSFVDLINHLDEVIEQQKTVRRETQDVQEKKDEDK